MWSMDAAGTRPFFGDHHAMVVYGRELFVLGGLGGGSGGKVMGSDNVHCYWFTTLAITLYFIVLCCQTVLHVSTAVSSPRTVSLIIV